MLEVFELVHRQSKWQKQIIIVLCFSFTKVFFLFLFAVCRTRQLLSNKKLFYLKVFEGFYILFQLYSLFVCCAILVLEVFEISPSIKKEYRA